MNEQFDELQWGKVLAEAWIDPDFKTRLESDPNTTLQEFARREFGMEIECSFDGLRVPDAPADMFAEHLSGSSAATGTATACATAAGHVSATACATASAGGHVSATACATASAGGHVSATACATASAGGHVSATACATASAGGHVNKD